MAKDVRLFVSGFKPDALMQIKKGLLGKPGIEMIISVEKPSDAENKINRQAINVLFVDLDNAAPEPAKLSLMQERGDIKMLYAAFASSRIGALPSGEEKKLINKPGVFTGPASANFIGLLLKNLEGYRSQIFPQTLNMRDIGKIARGDKRIIAIASSTGGTNALEDILRHLPSDAPPIVVVQHMPSGFTKLFADRLNAVYKLEIREAKSGDILKQGQLLLAPAEQHMKLIKRDNVLAVECFTGVKIHGVMPAADVLFESVAEHAKANAVGVILTGMGADGGKGMMLMHNAGAKTIGQNKETCVVYGMPKVAKDLGAIDYELPLLKIADKIMELAG